MNLTPYQARHSTHELTKRCAFDSAEKFAGAVASVQVPPGSPSDSTDARSLHKFEAINHSYRSGLIQ